MLWTVLIILGVLIILALGIYAGKLLFMLKAQNDRQEAARQTRIVRIKESIITITMAMEQQQCDLSEGAIRVVNLLDALPLKAPPAYDQQFPHIHNLFVAISGFPILEARQRLTKQERRKQDREREQIESEHETRVLGELAAIRDFCNAL
ncbi:DUF2489 domain-containing protein [Alteromonas sp. CYL-A6]|uniref:DUF2489 domain-containing protein n=1 Tax=Alteromonas nitratireducens TaxID=3390813 RepID=UPI0034C396D7